MKRRGILALLGSVGSVMSVEAKSAGLEPVAEALRRAQEVVALSAQQKADPASVSLSMVSERVNSLLAYLLRSFPPVEGATNPEVVIAQAGASFDEADYREVRPELIPLKIMRELVASHKVGFRIKEVPEFREFTARYRSVITELAVVRRAAAERNLPRGVRGPSRNRIIKVELNAKVAPTVQ